MAHTAARGIQVPRARCPLREGAPRRIGARLRAAHRHRHRPRRQAQRAGNEREPFGSRGSLARVPQLAPGPRTCMASSSSPATATRAWPPRSLPASPASPGSAASFHLQQNAQAYVPRQKLRRDVAADLRAAFNATSRREAQEKLEAFVKKWDKPAPDLARWGRGEHLAGIHRVRPWPQRGATQAPAHHQQPRKPESTDPAAHACCRTSFQTKRPCCGLRARCSSRSARNGKPDGGTCRGTTLDQPLSDLQKERCSAKHIGPHRPVECQALSRQRLCR